MSKFKSGVSASRKSSRRHAVPEEPTAHCSTSHFQPDLTYGDCDESSRFIPGSLAGMSPSSRGHTMKECEEQLSHLHKENFNLKLRIYFLEERLGHRGGPADAGTCEAGESLRAEVESLRAQLEDRQRLLCQAATAIDLVEIRHGEELARLGELSAAERDTLEERLAQLHKSSEDRCQKLRDEVARMSAELSGRRSVVSVAVQCDVDPRVSEVSRELEARGRQVADAEQRIRGLEEALSEKQPEIQIKVQELRERDTVIEEKQNQLEQQNRVLVEIQITLAEKQRTIDALNAAIAARDIKIGQLEAQLVAALAGAEAKQSDEVRELGRVRGENEMLKTQLKRMNRSREGRESPPHRRRTSAVHSRSRDSVSPRNKSLIEEGIEGIWSAPALRPRDGSPSGEEKENQAWRDTPAQGFSEEGYARLEREHRRGCEAIQAFVARIKHLARENDATRREWKRAERRLAEVRLEVKELRDSCNRAKWEAGQLRAEATGVPGTPAHDTTEEENERLWAEVEDKNKKLAQMSLDTDKQVQTLLASLREKETRLTTCEARLATAERQVSELEAKNGPSTGDGLLVEEISSLRRQLEFRELQVRLLGDRLAESGGGERAIAAPVNLVQHLHLDWGREDPTRERSPYPEPSDRTPLQGLSVATGTNEHPVWTTAERDDKGRRSEGDRLRADLCTAEVARRNATSACGLLAGRLEELAGFLETLLRRPDRLNSLETTFIRQAVERSVNLSRQLSVSISRPDDTGSMLDSIPDIGRYLEGFEPGSIPVTSCSTETLDELCGVNEPEISVIDRLRSQVETLKLEIRQRDIELNCLLEEHNLIKLSSPLFDVRNEGDDETLLASMMFYNNHHDGGVDSTDRVQLPTINAGRRQDRGNNAPSESETWSEPDRQISLARIGLPEEILPVVPPSSRHHHSRTLREDESSESSQETARETARTPAKRRGEALELRRLQTRLQGLEQVNEALRAELAILHQMSRVSSRRDSPIPGENHIKLVQTIENDGKLVRTVENAGKLVQTIENVGKPVQTIENDGKLVRTIENEGKLVQTIENDDKLVQTIENDGKLVQTIENDGKLVQTIENDGKPVQTIENVGKLVQTIENNGKLVQTVENDGKLVQTIENDGKPVQTIENDGKLVQTIENNGKHVQTVENDGKLVRTIENDGKLVQTIENAPELEPADDPIIVPAYLLEQIRRQREKLESSLFHNDFIRRRLEEVFLSATGETANLRETEVKVKLAAAEERTTQLEEKLRDVEALLADSRDQAARVLLAETRCGDTQRSLTAMRARVNELEFQLGEKDAELKAKEALVAELEEKVTTEVHRLIREMSELKEDSERRVVSAEERLREEKELLMNKVEGVEREIASYAERNGDIELELKGAREDLAEAVLQREEANKIIEMMKAEFSGKMNAFEETQREMEARMERAEQEGKRETERRSRKLEEAERQLGELRWAYKADVERKVKDVERLGGDVEAGLRRRAEVAEKRVVEAEGREAELRSRGAESERRSLERATISRRQQDEATVEASRAALERTRLTNERVRLEQEVRRLEAELTDERTRLDERSGVLRRINAELEQRVIELEGANAELRVQLDRLREGALRSPGGSWRTASPPLQGHCLRPESNGYMSGRGWSSEGPRSPECGHSPLSSLVLQRGFGRQHSEFSSDQDQTTEVVTCSSSSYWVTTVTAPARSLGSPDLGIDSDPGRLSSLEAGDAVQTFRRGRGDHSCSAVEERNGELQRELCQTRRALEETLAQLTASNRRKENVEKAICKQLHKTHTILQKTRGNLALCDEQT